MNIYRSLPSIAEFDANQTVYPITQECLLGLGVLPELVRALGANGSEARFFHNWTDRSIFIAFRLWKDRVSWSSHFQCFFD